MTIDELLNLEIDDISKLSRKELAKRVTQLNSAANKRIKRFASKGIETPATKGAVRSGGAFSVKGKSVNELRAEYVRVKTFLTAKTSTQKGYKKVQKEFEERIGGALSPEETKKFWSAYNRLSELEPNFLRLYGSARMQQYLHDEVTQNAGMESDDLLKSARERLNKAYEETEAKYIGEEESDDDFFELGEDL